MNTPPEYGLSGGLQLEITFDHESSGEASVAFPWAKSMACTELWQTLLSRLDNYLQTKAYPIIVACQWKRSSGDVGPASSHEQLNAFQKAQADMSVNEGGRRDGFSKRQ